MPINAGYEYLNAEKAYLEAQTLPEKIRCLEEMIRTAPKHKGSENLLAGLKTRLKKFLEKKEKGKKVGKSTQKTIRKEGYQIVLLGFPNTGKSSLLSALTNAKPLISSVPFSTATPEIGTLDYQGVRAQVVDLPAIGAETFDIGIVNTADCILMTLSSLSELEKITPLLSRSYGSRLIVFTKADLLSESELRKLQETVKSKKLPALVVSAQAGIGISELKERLIRGMKIIRVYTKEPGKPISTIPIILSRDSTVRDAAEKILKGFSLRIKETRISGPSSKFANQRVGLAHVLKDKDSVEFHTT